MVNFMHIYVLSLCAIDVFIVLFGALFGTNFCASEATRVFHMKIRYSILEKVKFDI